MSAAPEMSQRVKERTIALNRLLKEVSEAIVNLVAAALPEGASVATTVANIYSITMQAQVYLSQMTIRAIHEALKGTGVESIKTGPETILDWETTSHD